MQEERRTYTALVSLGDLTYDNDFLKSASKIIGIQAVYPVVEIPVTLKIEDYTETTAFYGIDLSAFVQSPDEDSLGTVPLLLLGKNSLSNMKDSNATRFPKISSKNICNGRGALHHLLPGYRHCI